MRKIKGQSSFKSLLLSVVIITFLSQFVRVKATDNSLLLLAYRDLDENHGELTVSIADMPSLCGATIPISFDPKVFKVCGVDKDGKFCEIKKTYDSDADLYSGELGITFSKSFFREAWHGNVLCNDYYPSIDNDIGLIKMMMYSLENENEIVGKNELCKIYFERLNSGSPQIAIAAGNTGFAYDKAAANGAVFLGEKTEYSVKIEYDGDVFYGKSSNVTIDADEDYMDDKGNSIPVKKETYVSDNLFSDVNSQHWASKFIYGLYNDKVISGYPDGTFCPDGYVTRAELTKMTVSAIGYEVRNDAGFSDVNHNDWFYNYVNAASYSGYIKGYPDKTFKPHEYITRQDLCTVLGRAFLSVKNAENDDAKFADDDNISDYSREYVYKMKSFGIINGRENDMFMPTEKATRAEVAKIIYLCMRGDK